MSMEMLFSIEEFKDFINKDYPVIVLFSTHGKDREAGGSYLDVHT